MTARLVRRRAGDPLTERQQQVRDYAARYRALHGTWPTGGQIKRHLGTKSDRYGRDTMRALIEIGDLHAC